MEARLVSKRNNRLKSRCGRVIFKHTGRTLITLYLGRFPVPPKGSNRASSRPTETHIHLSKHRKKAAFATPRQPAKTDPLWSTGSQSFSLCFVVNRHSQSTENTNPGPSLWRCRQDEAFGRVRVVSPFLFLGVMMVP